MIDIGHIERDNYALAWRIEGIGEPVVIPGSATFYPRTFSDELREHCQLVFMDLRHFAHAGPGALPESQPESPLTLDTWIEDIERLCAELSLETFTLLGHSHHGNLALEYARRHPEQVSRLAMIGTPPANVLQTIAASTDYWETHASERRKALLTQRRNEAAAEISRMNATDAFVRQYVADAPLYWNDPEYDASWLWQDVPLDPKALAAFRDFFADYEFPLANGESASAPDVPMLVIMGRQDYAVSPDLWNDDLRGQRNLTFHLFEHSGHTPQLEEPDRFDREFITWLRHS